MLNAAAEPRHPPLFGYGSGGEQDTDWGCVYRSFQNVLSFLHAARVPDLATLLQQCGKRAPQWAEPSLFLSVLPAGWRGEAFITGTGPMQPLHTPPSSYRDTPDWRHVFNVPHDVAPRTAFVVDDSVSGYAIVPWRGYWWWVDPHVDTPDQVRLDGHVLRHLQEQPKWMVLRVTRPQA